MKSNSNIQPQAIVDLGNGAFYYNFNVERETVTDQETGEESYVYNYDTVKVWDRPTYDKLVKAVIREEIDETAEFNFVNDYNAAELGMITDDEAERARESYKEYLQFVRVVKAQVKNDLAAWEAIQE